MSADPLLAAALRHWGARSVPFSENPGANPFVSPAWEQALRLLNQTAALRSLMLLSGDNGVGKSALVAYWLERLEPKAYLPLVITHATLIGSGLPRERPPRKLDPRVRLRVYSAPRNEYTALPKKRKSSRPQT
jgi:hypothetical protein